jgi:amidase
MSDPLNAFAPGGPVYAEGAADGPLSGLRFAAKDIFDVEGHVTGGGNPDWAATHAPAAETAPVVKALLEAGAALVGKTMTDELTRGILGINAHYGTPINPAAPDRVPGGSSSGSVRVPASFCGIYGIRPTHGRIALEGIIEQAPGYDTIGWFARDADTFARVGAVLLGTAQKPQEPTRLIIAEDAYELAGDAVREAHDDALDALRAAIGASETLRVCPGDLADWQAAMNLRQQWEASRSFAAWVDETNPRFGYDVAQRFVSAAAVSDADMIAAEPVRQDHRDRMAELLAPDTVIALPTTPGPAPLKELSRSDMWQTRQHITTLTCIAGNAGLPQVNLPLGRVDGLPVGLSLIGPKGGDEGLMALAREVG